MTVRMLSLLVTCVGLWGCGHPYAPPPSSDMTCVKRLQMPSHYPEIAQAARLSFEVTAAISLSADGRAQSVAFEGASDAKPGNQDLFKPMIEKTIRESEFEPSCGQKTVRIVYLFKMNVPSGITGSGFGYPNRVEVWGVSPSL